MKKPVSIENALLRMADLCARSEQCEGDIRQKLYRLGLPSSDADRVVRRLIEERFIDNARFARAFARDKCRFSGWGRAKIRMGLLAKRIHSRDIDGALAGIPEEDYLEALHRTATAKARSLKLTGPDSREDRVRLYRHILSRGFESELASRAVRDAIASENEDD